MSNWSLHAAKLGQHSIWRELAGMNDSIAGRFKRLRERNLPTYRSVQTSLSDFVEAPPTFLKELIDCQEIWLSFIPLKEGIARPRSLLHLSPHQPDIVVNKIFDEVSSENLDKYHVMAIQMLKNDYGGNMFIYDDEKKNSFLIEFCPGDHEQMVRGTADPAKIYSLRRTSLGLLEGKTPESNYEHVSYFPPDRRHLFESILHVFRLARSGTRSLDMDPTGYYEFILTSELSDSGQLSPIFLDYQDRAIWLK